MCVARCLTCDFGFVYFLTDFHIRVLRIAFFASEISTDQTG
jgi:hypothetical protein